MTVMDDLKYDGNNQVNNRFAFASAEIVISIIIIYLTFVYQIGPRWMKNRAALQLKYFISTYNLVQVASCLYLINRIWKLASWSIFNFKECVFYLPDTQEGKEFDDIVYKTFFLKMFELTDTIVFVLRKKQNQITFLHTFHHSSIISLSYLILKYSVGSAALFPIFLNSWIHVIMYTYYFFTNVYSTEVMKKFILLKKSITIMQMLQFCIVLVQVSVLGPNCRVSFILRTYYFFVVSVIFYGFFDFYKKSYATN